MKYHGVNNKKYQYAKKKTKKKTKQTRIVAIPKTCDISISNYDISLRRSTKEHYL